MKFRSTSQAIDQPQRETVTGQVQPGPAWARIIFSLTACLMIGLVALWHVGIFLLREAGAKEPERLLSIGIIMLVVFVGVAMLASWLFGAHFDRVAAHKLKMREKENEALRYRQMMALSMSHDTRTMGQQARFAQLVILVLIEAYDYAYHHGPYSSNTPRPWSRRQAARVVLSNESTPVGEVMGAEVRPWLTAKGVIMPDDQLNLDAYPDVGSVQRLLYQPVLLHSGAAYDRATNQNS